MLPRYVFESVQAYRLCVKMRLRLTAGALPQEPAGSQAPKSYELDLGGGKQWGTKGMERAIWKESKGEGREMERKRKGKQAEGWWKEKEGEINNCPRQTNLGNE